MQNKQNAIAHLKEHQTYPASKEELVKACNELSDFSEKDKKWFEQNLPERTYHSPEEVMNALGWKKEDMEDNKSAQMPI